MFGGIRLFKICVTEHRLLASLFRSRVLQITNSEFRWNSWFQIFFRFFIAASYSSFCVIKSICVFVATPHYLGEREKKGRTALAKITMHCQAFMVVLQKGENPVGFIKKIHVGVERMPPTKFCSSPTTFMLR